MLRQVGIAFPLCNNALQVPLTNELEQLLASCLDVVAKEKSFGTFRNHPAKP